MIILDEIREKQGARIPAQRTLIRRVVIPKEEEIMERVIPKDHLEPTRNPNVDTSCLEKNV